MKRICIFVDGENFRHSIGALFPDDYESKDYLPAKANWDGFFDHLVDQVADKAGDCERLRTYWYVVQSIDFYPRDVPDPRKFTTAHKVLKWDAGTKAQLANLSGDDLKKKVEELTRQMKDRKRSKQDRFRGWTDVQDEIALANDRVEFRRAGALRCNLFTNEFSGEKAVDVKLATDMIVLIDSYDVAVLVTGDEDYCPAVSHVKDRGRTVVSVAFADAGGKLLPGGARALNVHSDWGIVMTADEVDAFLGLRQQKLPVGEEK